MIKEPLSKQDAVRLGRRILTDGVYRFSRHADDELAKDDMTQVDAVNVIRGGSVQEIDFEHGTWRYRFETLKMAVVVAFPDEATMKVVTAWRK